MPVLYDSTRCSRLPVVLNLLRARPGSVVCYLARRLEIEHRLIGRHITLGLLLRHVARYLPGGAVSDCVEIENSGHFTDEWLLVVACTDLAVGFGRNPTVGGLGFKSGY